MSTSPATQLTVNGRSYRWMDRALVVVCIDGCEPDYITPEIFHKCEAALERYTAVDEVDTKQLRRWLAKARDIQWDYRNLIRRKGRLKRLK